MKEVYWGQSNKAFTSAIVWGGERKKDDHRG